MARPGVSPSALPQRPLALRAMAFLRVVKPRETALLAFIGWSAALVATDLRPPVGPFLLAALAVLLGSAGANGLTNVLDRHVDARMRRTRRRVLPAGLLTPLEAAVWSGALVALALGIAWALHPWAFMGGVVALAAALVARKTWATHFLGAISSCGPLWVGWLALRPEVTPLLGLLSLLVALWVPVHVWMLMLAYREDYRRAGVNIFPVDRGERVTVGLCLPLSVALLGVVGAIAWVGGFGPVFWVGSGAAGVALVGACGRTLLSPTAAHAFRAFRLTAFPFLGAVFLAMPLDRWVGG